MNCLVPGCKEGGITSPMQGLLVCYAHYAELWAHLDAQEPDKQNWPGSEPVIRAWVAARKLKKPETEARRA
jgi:hypothetical protein